MASTTQIPCPTCGGEGTIEVVDECKTRECENKAVYHYHNKISETSGDYCVECLKNLRSDVSIEEWLEGGFAEPIKSESRLED